MKNKDLIAQLQQFPPELEVCIFDWKYNFHEMDGLTPEPAGIYPFFEVEKIAIEPDNADDTVDFTPWIALNFSNPLIEDLEETVTEEKDRTCRVCGCTDDDCSQCIAKTGKPCCWVEEDLCSACQILRTACLF